MRIESVLQRKHFWFKICNEWGEKTSYPMSTMEVSSWHNMGHSYWWQRNSTSCLGHHGVGSDGVSFTRGWSLLGSAPGAYKMHTWRPISIVVSIYCVKKAISHLNWSLPKLRDNMYVILAFRVDFVLFSHFYLIGTLN